MGKINMREVSILALEMKDINKSASCFVLNMIEEMYRKDTRVVVFSNNFSNNFPSYITRKKMSITSLRNASRFVAKHAKNSYAIIAIDFPTNIIASMTSIRLKKKGISPYIIWNLFDFHIDAYKQRSKRISLFRDKLLKLDLKYSPTIDLITVNSKKIADSMSSIYRKMDNIKVINPGFPRQNSLAVKPNSEKDKYFLVFNKGNKNTIYKIIVAYLCYVQSNAKNIFRLKIFNSDTLVKNQITTLGLDSYIDIMPSYTTDDYKSAFGNAHSIIIYDKLTSLNIEFFESLSTKTLIIIDKQNALRDFIIDRENGIVVDSENPIALSNVFIDVSNNQAMSDTLTENAYDMLEKKFSMSSYTDNIISSINQYKR